MAQKEKATLAARVKELREAARLSQQDLAVKAGLSISVVSQIEQGKNRDPRVSTMEALAKALGTNVNSLLAAPGSKPRKGKS